MMKPVIFMLLLSYAVGVSTLKRTFSIKVTMTVVNGNIDNLNNAGSTYGVTGGDTLVIPNTVTGFINCGGLTGGTNNPIVVVVQSKITPYNFNLGNNVNVKFSAKLPTGGYGVEVTGATRGITCNGYKLQNVTFENFYVKNSTDYPIYMRHSRTYNGNMDSINYSIVFDSLKIYGGPGQIELSNGSTGYLQGLWQYFEIKNSIIDSTSGGNIVSAQHFFNGKFHDNVVTRTGLSDIAHVAIVHIGDGNCDFYNNYCRHIYGDAIRYKAGTSLVANDNSPMTISLVYNNVFTDFVKYPPIEINSNASTFDTSSSFIRPLSLWAMFNTCGNIKDSNFINGDGAGAGVLIAIYVHYGELKIWNNLSFNVHSDRVGASGNTNFLWLNGDNSYSPDTSHNLYSATGTNLIDTVTGIPVSNSGVLLKGTYVSAMPTGKDNVSRISGFVDVGAFQRTHGWSSTGRVKSFRKSRMITK